MHCGNWQSLGDGLDDMHWLLLRLSLSPKSYHNPHTFASTQKCICTLMFVVISFKLSCVCACMGPTRDANIPTVQINDYRLPLCRHKQNKLKKEWIRTS
jgi:hypothetical protein